MVPIRAEASGTKINAVTVDFAHVSSPPRYVGNYISIQSPRCEWLTNYIPLFLPHWKKTPFESCSFQRFNCWTQRVSGQTERCIFRVFQVSVTLLRAVNWTSTSFRTSYSTMPSRTDVCSSEIWAQIKLRHVKPGTDTRAFFFFFLPFKTTIRDLLRRK